MAFYILILIGMLLSLVLVNTNSQSSVQIMMNKIVFYGLSFGIILLTGMRQLSGTDTRGYLRMYVSGEYPVDIEPFYKALSNWFSSIGVSFFDFEIIVAVVTFLPILFVYSKWSKNPPLSVVLLYTLTLVFNAFNISRQMISVGWFAAFVYFLISFIEARGEKSVRLGTLIGAVISLVTAYNFHHSVLVPVIMLVAVKIVSTLRQKLKAFDIFFFFIAVFLALFSVVQSSFIVNFISAVVPRYFGQYSQYTSGVSAEYGVSIIAFFLTLLRLLLIFYPGMSAKTNDRTNNFIISIYLVATVVLGLQVGWVSSRLLLYFTAFIPIMIPNVFAARHSGTKQHIFTVWDLYYVFIVIVFVSITFFQTVLQNFGQFIPFQAQ